MTLRFTDKDHAQIYKTHRPAYSQKLFDFILDKAFQWIDRSQFTVAIDLGCGSGQATRFLTSAFDYVLGVDPSLSQLEEASKDEFEKKNCAFLLGTDRNIPVSNESCDYIQAFAAAHWFDLPAFYREVDRILKPGGVMVLGIYFGGAPSAEDNPLVAAELGLEAFDVINKDFMMQFEYLVDNNFLPAEAMKIVANLYRDLPLPYSDQLRVFDQKITQTWSIDHFVTFLKTWSGWNIYLKKFGNTAMLDDLANKWKLKFGDRQLIFSWQVGLLFARKPNVTLH